MRCHWCRKPIRFWMATAPLNPCEHRRCWRIRWEEFAAHHSLNDLPPYDRAWAMLTMPDDVLARLRP